MSDTNMTDPTDNEDPFADDGENTEADPFADDESASPLGEYGGEVNSEDDAMFDEYEVPTTPIGVLRGSVKAAAYVDGTDKDGRPKKSLKLEIQCMDQEYLNSATVAIWLTMPADIMAAAKHARALGLEVPTGRNKRGKPTLRIPRPEQWVSKMGMFTFCTWTGNDNEQKPQIARFGLPKEGTCDEFDAWASKNLSDSQRKAVAKFNGVAPLNTLKSN